MPRLVIVAMALAAPLTAQHCFCGDFGASLGRGTVDTVYPMQPIGFAFPLGGVTYSHIHVNDHGFVQLSNAGVPAPLTTNSPALYTPTVANFLAGGPKIAPLYSDMTLQGGGECWFESTPTQCTVTWHDAQSFGIPSPRFSFQLQLFPSGLIRFVYGPGCTNNSTYGGSSAQAIVGVTPGGGVAAPAPVDLSTGGVSASATTYEAFLVANAFDCGNDTLRLSVPSPGSLAYQLAGAPAGCAVATRFGAGCDGLGLGAIGLPAIGNADFRLRAETVPAASPLALFAFGTLAQDPGVPLGPALGMTGCAAHTNADLGIFAGSTVGAGPTGLAPISTYALPIPLALPLVGTTLATQAVAFSTANPFGLAASNGLQLRVGLDGAGLAPDPLLGMVAIAPGTFQMGSNANFEEQPIRAITLTRAFWIGRHEVTQAQYQAVMGSNPSLFLGASAPGTSQRPVEQASWHDARAYCAALTVIEQAAGRVPTGYEYRLPTEAEWEYCCRAGTTSDWNTGASLTTSQANFAGALANIPWTTGQSRVVGSYAPNAWGLFDMHGNVSEWCLDAWSVTYPAGPTTDPFVTGGATAAFRVFRGGNWNATSTATMCRSARRDNRLATQTDAKIGFRVVLAPVLVP